MLEGTVPPSSPVSASVLLVGPEPGEHDGPRAGTDVPVGPPGLVRAPGLAPALDLLAAQTVDCVAVDLGLPDALHAETWEALRAHSRGAVLLALVDGSEDDAHAGLHLADEVVGRELFTGARAARLWRRLLDRARVVNELRRTEEATRRMSAILEVIPDAIYGHSPEGIITSWNRGAVQLYGYTSAEALGRHVDLLHPPGTHEHAPIMAALHRGEPVRALETVRHGKHGVPVHVSLTICPEAGPSGELNHVTVLARDIGDRRYLEDELLRAIMHDGLTGLPNRASLVDRLSRTLARDAAEGRPVAVFFLDLDQFKRINEAQGHVAGDRVLAEVAGRLLRLVRGLPEHSVVARLGGDEFVLVSRDTDTAAAAAIADRIFAVLAAPVRLEGRAVHISASMGIAVSPPLDPDAESLLRHADAAMYEAKARGRSRSQIFDVSFAERSRDQLRLAGDLREALANDLLEVHYQPVVELDGQRLVGVEALARWEHPERGMVSPSEFVPLAEHSGFVCELDRWVLARACRQVRAGQVAGTVPDGFRVSVNLSARSLADPDLVTLVRDVLADEELPAPSLVLEITETALLQDIATARRSLLGLRGLGVGIALDDFGTGYSSLSFLRELPVTQVKIDRSFVSNVARNEEDRLITQSIVDLAAGLGLETVAEGVETEDQRALLSRLGCANAQGHLWSQALPLPEVLAQAHGASPVAPLEPGRHAARRGHHARRWGRAGWRRTPATPMPSTALDAGHQVAEAVRAGLDAGEAWLVVATAGHRSALREALGADHVAAAVRGGYVELDATEILGRILEDGVLDPERFDGSIGELVRHLHRSSPTVRVYAELTGLLLQHDDPAAASATEDLWEQLHDTTGVTVWCGYDADHPLARHHAEVCTRHDHVAWHDGVVRGSTAS